MAMPQLFRILNMSHGGKQCDRKRLWINPGTPVIVGPDITFRVFFDAYDETYVPTVHLRGPDFEFKAELSLTCWLDMSAWCDMLAIPRAMEINGHGRTERVLMEFIAVSDEAKWAS